MIRRQSEILFLKRGIEIEREGIDLGKSEVSKSELEADITS